MLAIFQYEMLLEEKATDKAVHVHIHNKSTDKKEAKPTQPQAGIDPATGQPIQQAIDPNTGQPIPPQIDPATGQVIPPQIDPATGQPIPPPTPQEMEVEAGIASLENIQKYILFLKLLEFKRQLEFHTFDTQINFKDYQECIGYLQILITFFETFTLDQLVSSITVITDKINLLLSVNIKTKKPSEVIT